MTLYHPLLRFINIYQVGWTSASSSATYWHVYYDHPDLYPRSVTFCYSLSRFVWFQQYVWKESTLSMKTLYSTSFGSFKSVGIWRRIYQSLDGRESIKTTMPPKRANGLLMGILDINKHFLSISPIRWQKYHQHNSSQSQDHLARPYRPTGLPMAFFIWCCRVKFSKTTIWIHKSVTLSQGLYLIFAWCRIYAPWQTPLNFLVTHIRVANPSFSLIGPRENLQKSARPTLLELECRALLHLSHVLWSHQWRGLEQPLTRVFPVSYVYPVCEDVASDTESSCESEK